MPHTYETRTFTIEIEVTARAHIQTGGSSAHDSDEPPWAEIEEIEIDYVSIGPYHKVMHLGGTVRDILTKLAEEEFSG